MNISTSVVVTKTLVLSVLWSKQLVNPAFETVMMHLKNLTQNNSNIYSDINTFCGTSK